MWLLGISILIKQTLSHDKLDANTETTGELSKVLDKYINIEMEITEERRSIALCQDNSPTPGQ